MQRTAPARVFECDTGFARQLVYSGRMLRKRQVFQIAFLTSLVLTTANAQTTDQQLDRFITKLIQNQNFSGTILVAERGKTVYRKSAGYADFSTKAPNTQGIYFPIASLSKTLTAIAILQLMEQ